MEVGMGRMALALAIALSGCDDDGETPMDAGFDAGAPVVTDAGGLDAGFDGGALDAGPFDCSPFEGMPCGGPPACRTVVEVSADVTSDTTWSCDNVYVLTDFIYVRRPDGAPSTDPQTVLTIEPGTLIRGRVAGDLGADPPDLPGALLVSQQGRVEAVGSAAQPIVFTSEEPTGSRMSGDWAGVALLGRAATNRAGGGRRLEGIPSLPGVDDTLANYGAPPGLEDDSWNCGRLEFVRIEFASFGLSADEELNGLTVGACGTDTVIDHVQVHRADDDGIEFFGGRVDASHLVITGAEDDGVDWDEGYTGRLQFVVVQQYDNVAGDGNGMELDGLASGGLAAPVSDARAYNVTLIGEGGGAGKLGMRLRDGTRGTLRNMLILGFAEGVFDVQGDSQAEAVAGALSIEHSIFVSYFDGVAQVEFPTSGTLNQLQLFVLDPARDNLLLAADDLGMVLPMPFAAPEPMWIPAPGSLPATRPAETPSEAPGETRDPFFDPRATYIGAFEPGGTDWTAGWTAFPVD